ncbi:DUF3618 domain-containing protein [Actinotalea sp.]|uniref:DUF3618 domain-containing protein n=1 Tax=Actinotalea sp. TaxID=1872145 RepID=UPI00356AA37C
MTDTHDIEADIARNRAELKATVDALSERLDPKAQADRVKDDTMAAIAELRRKATGETRAPDEPAPTTTGWVVLGAGAALALAVVTKVLRKL